MVLDLYLLRHGETEHNLNREIISGQSVSIILSERGEKQAIALGERLFEEGVKFDEVFSSTAERTKQTAKIVCGIVGFPAEKMVSVPELLELSQGEWEGKNRDEFYTPEILKRLKNEHWDFKAPKGESQKEVEERIYSWIKKKLLSEEKNLVVGIFGHGLAIKCLLRRIVDSDPELTYRICINNCSISRVKYTSLGHHAGWSVIKINDDSHLKKVGFNPSSFI